MPTVVTRNQTAVRKRIRWKLKLPRQPSQTTTTITTKSSDTESDQLDWDPERIDDDGYPLVDEKGSTLVPVPRDWAQGYREVRKNLRDSVKGRLPESSLTYAERFAQQHDSQVWQCFRNLIGQLPRQATWELGSLPLHLGGLGIRSASRTAHAAYWGSWADCLSTIRERHSNIAEIMSEALSNPPATAVHLQGVVQSRSSLATVGFTTPDWNSLLQGLRPRQPELGELDPGVPSHGWQFFAALPVEHHFRSHSVWPRLTPTEQALAVTIWPNGLVAFFFHPDFVALAFPPSALPCLAPPPPLASLAPCFSHLPVWPSTRRPWPPPCSVSGCWGVEVSPWRALLQGCVAKRELECL